MGGDVKVTDTHTFDTQGRLRVHGMRDGEFSDVLCKAVRQLLFRDPAKRLGGMDAPEAQSFARHEVFEEVDFEKVAFW